jgi:hypothetical protein
LQSEKPSQMMKWQQHWHMATASDMVRPLW